MARPLIDPREQVERSVHESEGIISPRRTHERQEQYERLSGAPAGYITCEQHVFHRANVGATGDGNYFMRSVIPSADTGFAMQYVPVELPDQGRILLVRLLASEDVTAGTAQAEIRATEEGDITDYTFEAVELSTTSPQRVSRRISWGHAVQLAADSTIEARIVTVGLTPATIDITMTVVIGYEDR